MAMNVETWRTAFRNYIAEWNQKMNVQDADVEATDGWIECDGRPTRLWWIFFWLWKDDYPLPEDACQFLGTPVGTSYGSAARQLAGELVKRIKNAYLITTTPVVTNALRSF